MLEPWKILKEYRVTEKANALASRNNQYTFEVKEEVTRMQVAAAVESVFKVKVKGVSLLIRKPKVKISRQRRCRPGTSGRMKKAIVTLRKGYKIEIA
ncbi:MAG: 50S ribosomal protein L23 [Puniceicoccales bacterium]|jgi:large subunit ribosomal protein L23|nr:50S ribosomal protein L23 [Puniceicoccales bacterium]